MKSGRLAEIRWSIWISKSHRNLCMSFSRTDSWLCIYHLYICSNFNFLHNSLWITLPTQSCLVLYSFCANLLHWLMRLFASFLSPHNVRLLFFGVLSILTLIWLVFMPLFCAAIMSDSISSSVLFLASSMISRVRCPLLVASNVHRVFFSLLFSGYCRSAGPHVVRIVLGSCDQSSTALLYVVFETLYQCVNAVFNAGKSSSSISSWHI